MLQTFVPCVSTQMNVYDAEKLPCKLRESDGLYQVGACLTSACNCTGAGTALLYSANYLLLLLVLLMLLVSRLLRRTGLAAVCRL